jgi:hypothetical protein
MLRRYPRTRRLVGKCRVYHRRGESQTAKCERKISFQARILVWQGTRTFCKLMHSVFFVRVEYILSVET